MLTRNKYLLENLVSTNKSSKQLMESSKQIIKTLLLFGLTVTLKRSPNIKTLKRHYQILSMITPLLI